MKRNEVITKIKDLEDTMYQVINVDFDFFQELLDDWFILLHALKFAGDIYFSDKMIATQERHDFIESKLPKVGDKTFNEYCVLTGMLGPLYY